MSDKVSRCVKINLSYVIFSKSMKRSGAASRESKASKHDAQDAPTKPDPTENVMGDFEDPYGDDFESEEEIFEAGEDGEPEKEEDVTVGKTQRAYIPHLSRPLAEGEVLEPDYSTYVMLHSMNVKWPCLSFDILPDSLGRDRRIFPQSMYLVTGTQAKRPKDNELLVLKMSSLAKTLAQDDDDDDDDDGDLDVDPILESKSLPCNSTTNRIRVSPFAGRTGEFLVAQMAENSDVNIWDVSPHVQSFDKPGMTIQPQQSKPQHVVKAHKSEGYAVDWSPLSQTGQLLTGDVDGNIYLSSRVSSGWTTDNTPWKCPGSVEEIQWSPVERTVFSSAGSDGHIRIWDTRQAPKKAALSVRASNSDVNVMSWNKKAPHLLASGHDDGSWGVWDLRTFTSGEPVASFDFHKSPITSLEFNPSEESVVSVGSEDSTVTLWDLSVEADDEEIMAQKAAAAELADIPSQLLFVHWQPNVKELHWHRQIPGTIVSTGSDGFSMWKTISV